MRKFWILLLALCLSAAVQAAELSREDFADQFFSALQAKDGDKIVALLQANPNTAQQVQQALQAAEGDSEDAQGARVFLYSRSHGLRLR